MFTKGVYKSRISQGTNLVQKKKSKEKKSSSVVSANGWWKTMLGFNYYVVHYKVTLKGLGD